MKRGRQKEGNNESKGKVRLKKHKVVEEKKASSKVCVSNGGVSRGRVKETSGETGMKKKVYPARATIQESGEVVVQAESIHLTCLQAYQENLKRSCDIILENIKSREADLAKIMNNCDDFVANRDMEDIMNSMVKLVHPNNKNDDVGLVTPESVWKHGSGHAADDVEGIRRCWEEAYMCEPNLSHEHGCAYHKTNNCVAKEMFKDELGDDFVLKEFFTPKEVSRNVHMLSLKEREHKPCILCVRNDVLSSVLNIRATACSLSPVAIVSRIHNFVGIKGEYLADHCICSLPNRYEGLIDPVVMPLKCYFEPFRSNGLRCLCQTIPKPEDVAGTEAYNANDGCTQNAAQEPDFY